MSLPANFPLQSLSAGNRRKLEWFYRRYVEEYYPEYQFGHFLLAAYAAVPALLTADLLYKLWQNFHQYQWAGKTQRIHRVAVSDILLSPLCREVGYELYEMEPGIRNACLEWLHGLPADPLWGERKIAGIPALAQFLIEYHARPNPARQRWGAPYEEAQEWNALAFTQPELLQQKIWQRLQTAVTGSKETETLRILDMWSRSSAQLSFGAAPEQAQQWQQHAAFAQAWKALLQHNAKAFTEAVTRDPAYRSMLDDRAEGGIAVQMPAAVKQQIDQWTQEAARRQQARALLVGIDEYRHTGLPRLAGSLNDVRDFQTLLENAADYLQLPLVVQTLLGREATRERVSASLDNELDRLQDGDHFVFFFAGNSANALQGSRSNKDGTLYLFDSEPIEDLWAGLRQDELEDRLFATLAEKAVTCLLVLDHPRSPEAAPTKKAIASSARRAPEGMRGSLVVLYGASDGESCHERMLGQQIRGVFPFALVSIIRERGFNLSFRNLTDAVRLRMTQLVDRQTPLLEAFPPEMAGALLLAHEVFEGEKTYEVHFRSDESRWVLAAGVRQGITPSLEFMHTLVKLKDGRILTVDEVYRDYATLRNFSGDGNADQVFSATLLQTALPKIRIAFDPGIDKKMEEQLRSVIQRYNIFYIDIRNKIEEGQYFIHSWRSDYFLSHQTSTQSQSSGSIKPIFNLEPDPYELIKQMEYIAQWTGVLEYQNPQSRMERSDFQLEVELFEGLPDRELSSGQGRPSHVLTNPQSFYLRDFDRRPAASQSSIDPGQDLLSGFQLRMTYLGEQPCFVQALYLSSTYGIQPRGGALELHRSDDGQWLEHGGDNPRMFVVEFPVKYLDLGISEIYDYLKLWVSTKPINTEALEQENLQLDREVTRTTIYRQETGKETFAIGDVDWMTITLPIRIVFSDRPAGAGNEPIPQSNIGVEPNIPEQEGRAGAEPPEAEQVAPDPQASGDKLAEMRRLIADARQKDAMDLLLDFTRDLGSEQQQNTAILLTSQLNSLERSNRQGIISAEEYSRSMNRIVYAMLSLIDELDRQVPPA